MRNATTVFALALALGMQTACAKKPETRDLSPLYGRIWRVSQASSPALGSIYIFLPNGTLLVTSCVETYRIATWTLDKERGLLRVTEDGSLAYTAAILELTPFSLRLRQDLVRSGEKREIQLSAIEKEFVCPDLPKR